MDKAPIGQTQALFRQAAPKILAVQFRLQPLSSAETHIFAGKQRREFCLWAFSRNQRRRNGEGALGARVPQCLGYSLRPYLKQPGSLRQLDRVRVRVLDAREEISWRAISWSPVTLVKIDIREPDCPTNKSLCGGEWAVKIESLPWPSVHHNAYVNLCSPLLKEKSSPIHP